MVVSNHLTPLFWSKMGCWNSWWMEWTITFGHKHGGFEEKEISEIDEKYEYKKEKFETEKYLEDAVRKHLEEKGKDHKAKRFRRLWI